MGVAPKDHPLLFAAVKIGIAIGAAWTVATAQLNEKASKEELQKTNSALERHQQLLDALVEDRKAQAERLREICVAVRAGCR